MTKGMDSDFVLIIDDDEDVCFLLSRILRSKGYRVEFRSSLKEGRQEATEGRPDVLLLDINLKDGNGLTFLEEKVIPNETHVVVMSAKAHLANKAKDLGAADFIAKPFTTDRLMEAIEKN